MNHLLKILFIAVLTLPFAAKAQDGKIFYIQSAMEYGKTNGACWDVPGDNLRFKQGHNIQAYSLGNTQGDRKFQFIYVGTWSGEKYYRIRPAYSYSASIDVSGNNHTNGSNIQVWEKGNDNEAQRFRLKNMGGGRWKIITSRNYVICLEGRNSKNGTNIHLWEDHDGPWMEWYLIDITTNKAFGTESTQENSTPAQSTTPGKQNRRRPSINN